MTLFGLWLQAMLHFGPWPSVWKSLSTPAISFLLSYDRASQSRACRPDLALCNILVGPPGRLECVIARPLTLFDLFLCNSFIFQEELWDYLLMTKNIIRNCPLDKTQDTVICLLHLYNYLCPVVASFGPWPTIHFTFQPLSLQVKKFGHPCTKWLI